MKFSVIIPVYRQWHYISELLDCLERQVFPKREFEVILVDNGGEKSGLTLVSSLNFKVVKCERPGSYPSRNEGIKVARGDWLVFTDADCLPKEGWLRAINDAVFNLDNVEQLLAGQIEVSPQSESPSAYEIYDIVKGIPQEQYVALGGAATANLVVRRKLALRMEGFNEACFSGGDIEFCRRAVSNGAKLSYLPAAVVRHRARTDWRQVSTKARRIKGGQLGQISGRQRILSIIRTFLPPLFAIKNFALNEQHSVRFRLIAIAIQLRIWLLEIFEVFRLAFRGKAERL